MAKKASTRKAGTGKKSDKKSDRTVETPTPRFEGEVMARAIADYADAKKAEDIVILDARGISPITDYFVICSVASLPQLRAVRYEIWEKMIEEHGIRPLVREDNLESLWLVLHYGDVMAHIFLRDRREFYALEDLWNDAPRVKWSPPAAPGSKKARRR